MISLKEPAGFNPKFEIVSCFVEWEGQFLLLLRQDHKSEGNTWGVPAGKNEKGEKIADAIVREIKEETGIGVGKDKIQYFQKVFVKYPTYEFIYHIFHTKLDKKSEVKISQQEHKAFKWVTPKDSLELPLIAELDNCIKLFYFS